MDLEQEAKALLEDTKKKRGEARGAPSEPLPEKEKTKGKEATPEEQAACDEEILAKKDEELNDDEKARKKELLKVKEKETVKEKDKQEKSNTQKRIDELTFKVKSLEEDKSVTKKERDEAKAELERMTKELSMTPDDLFKKKVKEKSQKRIQKYAEEDIKKPREERREMTKEELDEWMTENYEEATEWLTRRSIRRVREDENFVEDEKQKVVFSKILSKHKESEKKTFEKHPELDTHERTKALEKEGKKPDEVYKILCGENPKYKLCSEILKENPEKYMLSENGPELVVAEMEKRLVPKKDEKSKTEELEKKLADVITELERLKGIDVGIHSTHAPVKKEDTEEDIQLSGLASEVGLDPKKVAARKKERERKGYGR